MIVWTVIAVVAVICAAGVWVSLVSEQPTREERERPLYDWAKDEGAFPETRKPNANHPYFGSEAGECCLLWLGSPLSLCGRPRSEHR